MTLRNSLRATALASAVAALVLAGSAGVASAACVTKGGKGWGGDLASAQFQAWEAVLQATNWGMWSVWISGEAKVGHAASGYAVSNVRNKCSKENGQTVCIYQAKLCK